MNELILTSESLLSKWGFNDGDEPDALLDHYDMTDRVAADGYLPGKVWHHVLCRLVREHLIPRLDQQVETEFLDTNHNPIRALAVDGADVTHLWYRGKDPGPVLTPESVRIPIDVVMAAIDDEMRDAVTSNDSTSPTGG